MTRNCHRSFDAIDDGYMCGIGIHRECRGNKEAAKQNVCILLVRGLVKFSVEAIAEWMKKIGACAGVHTATLK